jgi:hypothetical protein
MATKIYVPTLDDLTVEIDELNRRIEAAEAKDKVRQDRPWVRDIICVLWATKSWVSKDTLDRELWALRHPSGLNMPEHFSRTVQSALNQHTSQSKVWERNGAKPEDDLFYSPKGKFSGTWAVHRERAVAWLKQRSLPEA